MDELFDRIIERRGTNSFKWDYAEMFFGTNDLIPMWVADMDFAAPTAVLAALQKPLDKGILGYTARPQSSIDALQNWLQHHHGWQVESDSVLFTPGVVPALAFALRAFTQPGDKVLIQTPVYHPFFEVIEENARTLVVNPLKVVDGRYVMDYADLDAKLATGVKLVFLCSPHNPVGRVWEADELRKLGELCRRYNALIVADEIHSDIVYTGHRHTPFAALSDDFARNSVSCYAPSKTFNIAGLSTAAAVIPNPELRARFWHEIESLGLHLTNIFGVYGFEAAYCGGEPWLTHLLSYLEGNIEVIADFAANRLHGAHLYPVEGTYLAWLDCRAWGMDDEQLKDFFVHEVKVAPEMGIRYHQAGTGHVRINFGTPRALLTEALERLASALDRKFS